MDRMRVPLEQRSFGDTVQPDVWRLRPLAVLVHLSAPMIHTPWAAGHDGCPGEGWRGSDLERLKTPRTWRQEDRFLILDVAARRTGPTVAAQ